MTASGLSSTPSGIAVVTASRSHMDDPASSSRTTDVARFLFGNHRVSGTRNVWSGRQEVQGGRLERPHEVLLLQDEPVGDVGDPPLAVAVLHELERDRLDRLRGGLGVAPVAVHARLDRDVADDLRVAGARPPLDGSRDDLARQRLPLRLGRTGEIVAGSREVVGEACRARRQEPVDDLLRRGAGLRSRRECVDVRRRGDLRVALLHGSRTSASPRTRRAGRG